MNYLGKEAGKNLLEAFALSPCCLSRCREGVSSEQRFGGSRRRGCLRIALQRDEDYRVLVQQLWVTAVGVL